MELLMLNLTSNGCAIAVAIELGVLNGILSTDKQVSWESIFCFFVLFLAAANGTKISGISSSVVLSIAVTIFLTCWQLDFQVTHRIPMFEYSSTPKSPLPDFTHTAPSFPTLLKSIIYYTSHATIVQQWGHIQ